MDKRAALKAAAFMAATLILSTLIAFALKGHIWADVCLLVIAIIAGYFGAYYIFKD